MDLGPIGSLTAPDPTGGRRTGGAGRANPWKGLAEGHLDGIGAAGQDETDADTSLRPIDPKLLVGVARNAPCPCGSGKKFKHCHGSIA